MALGSPSTSSYLRASPESQFRNSSTDIRAEILANPTIEHSYQNFRHFTIAPRTGPAMTAAHHRTLELSRPNSRPLSVGRGNWSSRPEPDLEIGSAVGSS